MDYAIIPTLGPATESLEVLHALTAAGATAFRLNTSHLSRDDLERWLDRLSGPSVPPPLVLDLQGSKWRLGQLPTFSLREGQRVDLVLIGATTTPSVLPVPHADFFRAAAMGSGEI